MLSTIVFGSMRAQDDGLIEYTFTGIGAGGVHVPLDSVHISYYIDPTYKLDLDRDTTLTGSDTVLYVRFSDSQTLDVMDPKRRGSDVWVETSAQGQGNYLNFYMEESEKVQLTIHDIDGRELFSQHVECEVGLNRFRVGFAEVGLYMVGVKMTGHEEVVKVVSKEAVRSAYSIEKEAGVGGSNISKASLRSADSKENVITLPFERAKFCCFNVKGYTTYKGKVYESSKQQTRIDDKWVLTFLFDEETEEEGLLPGTFQLSKDGTKKIRFSKGNLQYRASTDEWRFAEHQQDYVGVEGNLNASALYDGWIDLFAWGTSGYDGKYPYLTDICRECGRSFGNGARNITDTNFDWGVYNPISNGGNRPGLWHTMTDSEWYYLERYRANADKLRGFGSIEGVGGLILLPEYWDLENDAINTKLSEYTDNVYTQEEWAEMEKKGAVFLPNAGCIGSRDIGDAVEDDRPHIGIGVYMTSIAMADICCYCIDWGPDLYWNNMLLTEGDWRVVLQYNRSIRNSVRLVQYVK